jgi:hypothetical protein
MTLSERKALKAGDRVMWMGDELDLGTITYVNGQQILISWDIDAADNATIFECQGAVDLHHISPVPRRAAA